MKFRELKDDEDAAPAPSTLSSSWEDDDARRRRIRSLNLADCRGICIFFTYLIIFSVTMVIEQTIYSSQVADHIQAKLGVDGHALGMITSTQDTYGYLRDTFIPALYVNSTDTNLALKLSPYLHPLDLANRMVGGARVRQVRVSQTGNCQIGPMFSEYATACHPPYREEEEATTAFGTAMMFKYEADPAGSTWDGRFADYGPNGYMVFLPVNKTEALEKVKEMEDEYFLGESTRAVFLDFTVWSSFTGIYAVVTICFEFGPTSSTETRTNMLILAERNLRLGGFGTSSEVFGVIGQALIIFFLIFYLIEEAIEFWKDKKGYFLDGWNVLDWTNMLIILASFALRALVFGDAAAANIAAGQIADRNSFVSLRGIGEMNATVRLLNSLNLMLLWLKCTKYLRKVPVVKDFLKAIWGSLELFVPFVFLFCFVFVGFNMAYNLGFGDQVEELSTFYGTLMFLMRSYLRDVKIKEAYEVDPVLCSFLVVIHYVGIVLIGTVVINAIVSDSIFEHKLKSKGDEKDDDDCKEDEPVEEFLRVSKEIGVRAIVRYVPRQYHRHFKPWRKATQDGGFAESDDGDGAGAGPGGAHALRDRDQGSSLTGDSFRDEDENYVGYDEQASRKNLIRAIEHMSGRVLSEISIVSIEVKSELHDVSERVAQMQMAVDELAGRTDKIAFEQQELIRQMS